MVASCELLYRLALLLAGIGAAPAQELVDACFTPDLDLAGEEPPLDEWLERLPLLRALRHRLAALQNGGTR